MPLRSVGTLLALFGLVLPAHAQAEQVQLANHELIAAALEGQGVLFLRRQDTYSFTLKSQPLTLTRLDDGGRLVIKASITRTAPLDPLNVETALDCKSGVTSADIQKFIAQFGKEVEAFRSAAAAAPALKKEMSAATNKQKVPVAIRAGSDDKELIIHFPTSVPPERAETAWKIIWDMETGKQAGEQGFKTVRKNFPNVKKGGPAKDKDAKDKKDAKGGDAKDPDAKKDDAKEKKDAKQPAQPAEKIVPGFGFWRDNSVILFKIKKAYYKPGPKAEWIQVLEDAHPQEFYVPYYFVNTRFFDLRDVGNYVELSEKEGGNTSQLLSKSKRVMAELRDRGVAYKHGNITRRGEEFTLWANFAAGNYTYMVEFGFHDDGTIVFRHAPTGWNYYSHFNASHMHGSYWRVGIKLGPEGKNTKNQVQIVRLPGTKEAQGDPKGKLAFEDVKNECFVDWKAEEFTRIRVTNPDYSIVPKQKDGPLPIAYDLVSIVQGVAKHERFKDERFTLHPFWITRHDCPEKMYVNLGNYFLDADGKANEKVLPLEGKNVTIWHSSAGLHTPRAEDGITGPGGSNINNGQATIYWTTFELRPRNLFTKTPLYKVAE